MALSGLFLEDADRALLKTFNFSRIVITAGLALTRKMFRAHETPTA
jgi:hypothetical protein